MKVTAHGVATLPMLLSIYTIRGVMDTMVVMAMDSGIGLTDIVAIGAIPIMVFTVHLGELAGVILITDMDIQVIMVTDMAMVTDTDTLIITMVPLILMYRITEADAIPITIDPKRVEDQIKTPLLVDHTTELKQLDE